MKKNPYEPGEDEWANLATHLMTLNLLTYLEAWVKNTWNGIHEYLHAVLFCTTTLNSIILTWGYGALEKSKNVGSMHVSTKPVVATVLVDCDDLLHHHTRRS
jgi:hypothetical protein